MGRIGTIFRASPVFLLGMIALLAPRSGCALEIAPFDTFDQSPLVQIYGLPAPGSATVLQRGQRRATLAFDLASNYAVSRTSREQILLDGETARATFSAAAGVPGGYELGLALPAVDQGGGFLDGFIDGWHRFFHLPDGGRPQAPKGRLLYRYDREGGAVAGVLQGGGRRRRPAP